MGRTVAKYNLLMRIYDAVNSIAESDIRSNPRNMVGVAYMIKSLCEIYFLNEKRKSTGSSEIGGVPLSDEAFERFDIDDVFSVIESVLEALKTFENHDINECMNANLQVLLALIILRPNEEDQVRLWGCRNKDSRR